MSSMFADALNGSWAAHERELERENSIGLWSELSEVYRRVRRGELDDGMEYEDAVIDVLCDWNFAATPDELDATVLDGREIRDRGGPAQAAAKAVAELSGVSSRQVYRRARGCDPEEAAVAPLAMVTFGISPSASEMAAFLLELHGGSPDTQLQAQIDITRAQLSPREWTGGRDAGRAASSRPSLAAPRPPSCS